MSGINEQVINAEIYQIGPQGIPGEAATVSVGTVTTGEPGTDASVTNSGTSTAAVLDFVIPQGAKGAQGEQGQQGIQGLTGATGNGIDEIVLYDTTGLIKTYRINFTDNTHFDFEVSDGSSISDIQKTSTSGLVDTYTITLTNGDTHTFTVTNGAKGDKGETGEVGNGILGIVKMSTTGLVDNYQINFTNGTHYNYDLANGKGITSITLLSWVGLIKTYRILFNDGTYFDYEVTNGAGGQTEWGGITGVISQQPDLQNSFHALKSYADNGELLTDAEGLQDVKNYAHSTFDLSKFTVTGSPVITSDGIATDFSGSNRVTTTFNYSGSTLEVETAFYFQTDNDGANIFQVRNSGNLNVFRAYLGNDGAPRLFGVAGETMVVVSSEYSPEEGDLILLKMKLNSNSTITGKVINYTKSITVTKTTTGTITNSPSATGNILYIGNANGNEYYIGSIDLKYTSVKNNDVEIFSGNKTGVDTIKPDDYTVTGTPTISADGVASGFSDTTNYVKTAVFSPGAKPWKIYRGFTTSTVGTTQRIYCSKNFGVNLSINSSNHFVLGLSSDGTSNNIGSVIGTYTVLPYTHYIVCAEFTGTEYRLTYSLDGKTFTSDGTLSSATTVIDGASDGGKLGTNSWFTNTQFLGSIDLNECRDFIGGNLVYQPCLKIPYTFSKTGSKVVNSVYRDRVNDMAEQFGYANYYTLDEDNGNFTLPQVELYGLIGDKTLKDSYYNGVTYWELFSNRRLEQGGSCESGVEYTLPKPFTDANYVLTIPYSSKTATSFIPSATGDFIAKGMGLL